jgi:hypothetical protein
VFEQAGVPNPMQVVRFTVEDGVSGGPALVAVIRAVHATAAASSAHGDFFTEEPGDRPFVTRIVSVKVGTLKELGKAV